MYEFQKEATSEVFYQRIEKSKTVKLRRPHMLRIILSALFICLTASIHADNLKNYTFTKDTVLSVQPEYSPEVLVNAVLFEDFDAVRLVVKSDDSKKEVKNLFNLELKKRILKASIKLYDYTIMNSFRVSKDSRTQEGTLKVDSANLGEFLFYSINPIKDVSTVLSGDIEFFQFDKSFGTSFMVVNVKLFNRDSGYIYWLSTLTGRADEIMDYLIKSLTTKK